jgi:hypothetical protein
MLQHVATATGRGYGAQLSDLCRFCLRNNKLTVEEYFALQLYDARIPSGEKLNFIGITASRHIWAEAYRHSTWVGIIRDKLAAGALFKGLGYRVPEIVACFSPRLNTPGTQTLSNARDIEDFLRRQLDRRLFGKPIGAMQSLGSIAIDSIRPKEGTLLAASGEAFELAGFAALIEANYPDGYVFQERLSPHSAIRDICGDRLATVRLLTVCQDGVPDIVGCLWKIPAGANMADNFWRSGNIAAEVDAATGRIGRAIQGTGIRQAEIAHHPETGAEISGITLPHWQDVLALVRSAALVLKDIPLIGWDIGITPHGPFIVEANATPDLMLLQYVTRLGTLSTRFRAFLAWLAEAETERGKAGRRKLRNIQRQEAKRLMKGAGRLQAAA